MTRANANGIKWIEGVPYYKFRVRFRLADGRRRVWLRWSPGFPWFREELARELEDRGFRPEDIDLESWSIQPVTP